MAHSATCHSIPERAPDSVPANDAAPNDAQRGQWLVNASALELMLLQAARHERVSAESRFRTLRACGIR